MMTTDSDTYYLLFKDAILSPEKQKSFYLEAQKFALYYIMLKV